MKSLGLALTFTGALFAQSFQQPPLFPYGAWAVCSSPARMLLPDQSVCDSLVGGTEEYLLLVHASSSSSLYYEYTITATVVGMDQDVIVIGVVKRKDNTAGYTQKMLGFGGVVVRATIKIKELGVVGER